MYKVVYFVRVNNNCPILEWLDSIELGTSSAIITKFRMLEVEGTKLLGTNILKKIEGQPNLFEIKYSQFRVLTYLDEKHKAFIILNGFRKQKMNERGEIMKGVRLKEEYIAFMRGCSL